MKPPASFAFLIATAQSLAAAVNTRDHVHIRFPLMRQAVAVRLSGGLRVLGAFLRRLIILMALELEWGLVDTRRPNNRRHISKPKPSRQFTLRGLDAHKVSPWLNGDGPKFQTRTKSQNERDCKPPIYVDMTKLYGHLDYLLTIAANPTARAKRLAFCLARQHPGIIIAPAGPKRISGRWGTEARASFDAMAQSIITKSRNRPPPLPPPRRKPPTIHMA